MGTTFTGDRERGTSLKRIGSSSVPVPVAILFREDFTANTRYFMPLQNKKAAQKASRRHTYTCAHARAQCSIPFQYSIPVFHSSSPVFQSSPFQSTELRLPRQLKLQYDERDCDFVLQNRIGWEKFNTFRLQQSYETIQQAQQRVAQQGIKARCHGVTKENLDIDQVALLQEASTWPSDKEVNWSDLEMRYNLTCLNRGQVIKEFLAENGIPAAKPKEGHRVRRKKMRLCGGEISQPTHGTIHYQKSVLQQKLERGDYCMGELIAPTDFVVYRVNKGDITERMQTVCGRLIPLYDIRQRLLTNHSEMGILRINSTNPKSLSSDELREFISMRPIHIMLIRKSWQLW